MDLWVEQGCGQEERRAVTQYREPIVAGDVNSQRIDSGQINRWSRDDNHSSNGWRKYGTWIVLALACWLAIYGGYCLVQKAWEAF